MGPFMISYDNSNVPAFVVTYRKTKELVRFGVAASGGDVAAKALAEAYLKGFIDGMDFEFETHTHKKIKRLTVQKEMA